MAQLWDISFKPQHLQGGFRETGLFPFTITAIPSWKYAPALPLQASSPKQKQPSGIMETPLRAELRKCFIEAIKPTEAAKKSQRRQRIQSIHHGEALSSDEVLELLKEEEMEKKKHMEENRKEERKALYRKKTKRQSKEDTAVIEDENHCQIRGAEFQEEEEETCLGCDGCWRWVHCYCAGLDAPPNEETPWFCDHCQ